MTDIGGMPRRVFAYSAAFHLAVVLTLYGLVHWHFFSRPIPEETPIVVQLVNVAEETRATQVTRTPPKPSKSEDVAQVEAPKPPKPEPPKPEPPPPSPPPSPKPEPPKPEPPKPEPPKPEAPKPPPPPPQEAKAEAPKPEPPKPAPPPAKPAPPKKSDDVLSDQMLRNLAKRSPTHPTDEPPQKMAAAQPAKPSSQPVAPLGSQLTTSETDLIKQQLYACWNIPLGARDAKDLTPEFRVFMNSDGTVRDARQLNAERNSDPFFQAAAESAMRALRNPRCQPLKFPPQKYEQWQTFTITFDPKDVS
jgi:outer membrane biosynthesis protein TonB